MKKLYWLILPGFVSITCKQPYEPDIKSFDQSFLVVEGNLNVAHDSTIIRVTRSSKLDATTSIKPENNAILSVEETNNNVRNLVSAGNGYYVSPDLNLVTGNEYRLHIKTGDGKEYVSGYVKAKDTPGIDSVGWEKEQDGVHIYVNAHDASNITRYYRWEYDETWEIHSPFGPDVIYENGRIRDRMLPEEQVSTCWRYHSSTQILMGNSVGLQSDIINKAPLLFIPVANEKILYRYSVLVKQYALDKDAYNFLELMKRNTEDIGSFLGPQPSELTGNITCITNPGDVVIGFITASTVSQKRIFITYDQVFPWNGSGLSCSELIVDNNSDSIRKAIALGYIPVAYLGNPPDQYTFSTPDCVDCTTIGGSAVKPSYW